MKRRLFVWMIAGLASAGLALVSIGCSSDSGGGGAQGGSATNAERMDVKQTFDQLAGWFPAETAAVGFFDNMDQALGTASVVPPTSVTGIKEGDAGSPEALAKDIEKEMKKRLGIDPTTSNGLVMGGGVAWQTVVLLGDFEPSGDNVETSKVAGTQAYKFPTKNFSKDLQEWTDAVWATALDGGKAGLAFFRSKSALKRALEAESGDTLEGADSRKTFDKLVAASTSGDGSSRLTVISPIGELSYAAMLAPQVPFSLPSGVAVSLGSHIKVDAIGEKKTLDEVEKYVKNNVLSQLDDQISEMKSNMDSDEELPAGEATSAITGYHFLTAYRKQLDPKRNDGRLTYSVAQPFAHMSSIASVGMLAGLAVPAFTQYMKRSIGGGGMGGGGLGGGMRGGSPGGGMGGGSPSLGGGSGDAPSDQEIKEMQKKLKQQQQQFEDMQE